MKSLKERVQSLGNSHAFMNDREKGDQKTLIGERVTINDFGIMHDKEGDYMAYTIKEDDKRFFFAGKVLTQDLTDLEAEGYKEAIQNEGLPVEMFEKRNKGGKPYTAVKYL